MYSKTSYTVYRYCKHISVKVSLKIQTLTLIYMVVGLYATHSFEWPFLLKFLYTKIVKQFVFIVQRVVFTPMFLNLLNNNAVISC